MCNAYSFWQGELDLDRVPPAQVGSLPLRPCQESPKMATTSIQHCCYSSPGYGDNEVEDPVSETKLPKESPGGGGDRCRGCCYEVTL